MKRRRNLLVETLTALGPTGAMAGAELVKGRPRLPAAPPTTALPPVAVPSFKTVREWDDRFGGPKLGVLEVSYERLAEAFGAPTPTKGDGVDLEWWPEVTWYIAYDDGSTAMIYDWQLTDPVEQSTVWHVAGADPVLDYIARQLDLSADAVKDQRVEFRTAANPRQPNPTRKLAQRLKR